MVFSSVCNLLQTWTLNFYEKEREFIDIILRNSKIYYRDVELAKGWVQIEHSLLIDTVGVNRRSIVPIRKVFFELFNRFRLPRLSRLNDGLLKLVMNGYKK